jgi:hypothetical protein
MTSMLLLALLAAPADFSGTWRLSPEKSKNLGMMSEMKMTATVRQTDAELVVSIATVFNDRTSESSDRYDLAGKPSTNESPMEGKAETISKWDAKKLVTTWTFPGSVAGTTRVRVETRSLSPDGRTMTVESRRQGSDKSIVFVFERF